MALKNLPLGISTLSKLLENNCIYVDKTEYAYNLTSQSGAFFLSRPRRFGKSLFVDTLKEIFEGNQKLFEGLFIYDKWDWSKKYPVIKLDFAGGGGKNQEELDLRLKALLQQNKDRLGIHYDSFKEIDLWEFYCMVTPRQRLESEKKYKTLWRAPQR